MTRQRRGQIWDKGIMSTGVGVGLSKEEGRFFPCVRKEGVELGWMSRWLGRLPGRKMQVLLFAFSLSKPNG